MCLVVHKRNPTRPSGRVGAEHGVAWKTKPLPALSPWSAESPQGGSLAALSVAGLRNEAPATLSAAWLPTEDL